MGPNSSGYRSSTSFAAASVEALNGPQDFIPKFQKLFEERRDLVDDGIGGFAIELRNELKLRVHRLLR